MRREEFTIRAAAEEIISATISRSRQPQPQSQSFGAELSDKLAKSSALPASATASQRIAPWRDPISTPGRTTPISTTPTTTPEPSGLNGLVITYPSSPTVGTAGAAGAEGTAKQPASEPLTFDQAYWANQPAAVQQLQNIQDPQQRTQVAEQLAGQGYSVDVPIMVWGWDPGTTMAARQSMGYTWVPSAEQQPVGSGTRRNVRGGASYNPASLQRVPSPFRLIIQSGCSSVERNTNCRRDHKRLRRQVDRARSGWSPEPGA